MAMTQQTTLPHYLSEGFTNVPDNELIEIIKEAILNAIIENRVYYDNDDVGYAIDTIYPTVFNIVFNTNYFPIRSNDHAISDLITYLVTHIA